MTKNLKHKLNNKFLKSGLSYTIGNFALKGIGLITVPIFTAILSTSDYGKVNTYNAWLSIITIAIGLNLYSSIRNAFVDYKENIDNYLSNIVILSLIFVGLAEIVSNFILIIIHAKLESIIIINMLIIQSYATFIITLVNTKYTFEYRYKGFLFNSYFSTILNIVISVYLIMTIFSSKAYLGRVLGGAIPTIILSIFLVLNIFKKGGLKINKDIWKYALIISIPLIPHSLSQFILSQSDRIMISYYSGDTYTGIYSFTYNISILMTVLWTSLDSVWVPWFTEAMRLKDYSKIRKVSNVYIIIFSIFTILVIFSCPEIVKILTRNKSYWVGIEIIPPIAISCFFIFLYSLPVNVEYFYKQIGLISIGTFISAIINIVLNMILLPKLGYQAAAYTTLIAYVFLFVFHWINMKKLTSESVFNLKLIMASIFVVLFFSIFFMLLKEQVILRYLIILIIMSGTVSSYFKYKKLFKSLK